MIATTSKLMNVLRKQIKSNDLVTAVDKHPSLSVAKHKIETGHKIDPYLVNVLMSPW